MILCHVLRPMNPRVSANARTVAEVVVGSNPLKH